MPYRLVLPTFRFAPSPPLRCACGYPLTAAGGQGRPDKPVRHPCSSTHHHSPTSLTLVSTRLRPLPGFFGGLQKLVDEAYGAFVRAEDPECSDRACHKAEDKGKYKRKPFHHNDEENHPEDTSDNEQGTCQVRCRVPLLERGRIDITQYRLTFPVGLYLLYIMFICFANRINIVIFTTLQ